MSARPTILFAPVAPSGWFFTGESRVPRDGEAFIPVTDSESDSTVIAAQGFDGRTERVCMILRRVSDHPVFAAFTPATREHIARSA